MKKIRINMLSNADKVNGQGVKSAYLEQVALIQNELNDLFDVVINDKQPADILHCHTILPNYLMKMKKHQSQNVVYVHFLPDTLDGSIRLPHLIFQIFKKYVIYFYNAADYLIVVNPMFINDLVDCGIDQKKIRYIPNYVSHETFYKEDESKRIDTRRLYGIGENDFVVLGVGQVQTRKGIKDFVEVAKSLPHVTFIWAGGFSFGKMSDGYDEFNEIYHHPPFNVHFIGIVAREKMNDIYNMADVLFMPSYNELFPMSILEAINSQKPLILRDLDLYKDILFEKYLCSHDNDGFIKHIKDLQENHKLHQKYSQLSYEISQYYTKEHVKNMWKDFYLSILKGDV